MLNPKTSKPQPRLRYSGISVVMMVSNKEQRNNCKGLKN